MIEIEVFREAPPPNTLLIYATGCVLLVALAVNLVLIVLGRKKQPPPDPKDELPYP